MRQERIICIRCPMGCEVILSIDEGGEVVGMEGQRCKEGKEYALEEYRHPVRVLTTTLLTEGGEEPLLAVRSSKGIPKGMLREAMRSLAKVRVRPPVKVGEKVVEDLLGTGVDIVATEELS